VLGIRTVRRLVVVMTGLALVGPLSVVARPDVAAAAPNDFVTMSDGVSIAVNVRMPTNYIPGQRYPTVFEMSGYDGGSANGGTLAKDVGVPPSTPEVPRDDSRQLSDLFNGEFDLFSWRSALDGKEIIDNWIPTQSWSNGDVGLLGHSYGGITGFMVAATQPQHLEAATLSGLIDDLYRGIVNPGGVSNYGFPLLWTGGIRTAYDVGGGLLPGLVRPQRPEDAPNRQEQCGVNVAGKSRTVTNDPIVQGLADTDNDWYRSRSLITYVDKIKVPIHIVGAYQDEQTGPRGQAHFFERIGGVSKRLILTNGDHNTESTADYGVGDIRNDRKA
jgi:pimeloyl-ACP methyl ester carboxylesterase